jgi:hypothetical protein
LRSVSTGAGRVWQAAPAQLTLDADGARDGVLMLSSAGASREVALEVEGSLRAEDVVFDIFSLTDDANPQTYGRLRHAEPAATAPSQ